jgi:hypothetical protein
MRWRHKHRSEKELSSELLATSGCKGTQGRLGRAIKINSSLTQENGFVCGRRARRGEGNKVES